MKGLRVGQKVWVEGFTGTFTVVKVYATLRVADLELATETQKTRLHLPFGVIHQLGEYAEAEGLASEHFLRH
jgi:hypothetical protein